jgi:hypothetical protein
MSALPDRSPDADDRRAAASAPGSRAPGVDPGAGVDAEDAARQARRERRAAQQRARRAAHRAALLPPAPPEPGAFDADDGRMVEARRRLAICRYALGLAGGVPARHAAVADAILTPGSPLYALGPAPSLPSLQRWLRRYAAAGGSFAGLIDRPRSGRPPTDLTGPAADYLRREARARAAKYHLFPVRGVTGRPQWARLTALVRAFCEGRGLPAPSRHAVRRFVRAMSPAERALAAFGTKAARALVAPKAVNPTERAHELVFADEVRLPTQIRVFDDATRTWVSAYAWALFLLDAFSRAILAFWVKPPTAEPESQRAHAHLSAREVMGVIAGVIVPELAHPAFATFARGEPGELRLDGSGNTAAAARLLAAKGCNATLGEPNAPWARGVMERYFQTLKGRDLGALVGDKDLYLPFDPEREDPRTTRTRDNADKRRMAPVKLEIPVESLGRYDHLVAAVQHAVDAYNTTPHSALGGRAPLAVYEETAPRPDPDAARRSVVLGLFPAHALTVEARGVCADGAWYNSDALQQVYAGARVLVRRDPLGRGAFVWPEGLSLRGRTPHLYVPTREAWARGLAPDAFAKAVRAEYGRAREAVNADRRASRAESIGRRADADVQAAVETRADRQRHEGRRLGPQVTPDGEDTAVTGRPRLRPVAVILDTEGKPVKRPKKAAHPDGRTDVGARDLRRDRLRAREADAAGGTGPDGAAPAALTGAEAATAVPGEPDQRRSAPTSPAVAHAPTAAPVDPPSHAAEPPGAAPTASPRRRGPARNPHGLPGGDQVWRSHTE